VKDALASAFLRKRESKISEESKTRASKRRKKKKTKQETVPWAGSFGPNRRVQH
jgi:hypothetical protein